MTSSLANSPVVIIGAGRSGTNVLRDTLCEVPGYGTWPCDEINYIWRHGNVRVPHDELEAKHARTEVRRFIRRAFEREQRRQGLAVVVEKTCANSLRVPFVDAILPDARYIQIVRDGRDVVASARERWTAPLDLRYIARKARYVPPSDLPWYAARYAVNRMHRLISSEGRLSVWGPRFRGMDEVAREMSLEQLCAMQWSRCVDLSSAALANIPPERVHRIHYEKFASDPVAELARLGAFLGVTLPGPVVERAASNVSSRSIGRWKESLDRETALAIEPIMRESLVAHGYEI